MEKKTDYQNFLKLLTALGELFDKKLSDTLYELYWEALKDLPFEDFSRAANILGRSSKFFPKPVEFRELLMPDISAQAALAYRKVEEAFIKAGIYKAVIFDDPVIHAVMDNLGGWIHYCNLPEDEVKWYRKEFEKHYANFAPLVATGKLKPPTVLHGFFALASMATDSAKTPVLIGDEQKALAWTSSVRKEKELEAGNSKKLEEALPKLQRICSPDRVAGHGAGDPGISGRVLPGGEPERAV